MENNKVRKNIVQIGWSDFLINCVPSHATPDQISNLRIAFYLGVNTLVMHLAKRSKNIDFNIKDSLLDVIVEVDEFSKSFNK